MPDLLHALQNGAANLWLFIPSAILLGALHGLEPGHSKTMMAAFIIAIRGTIWQAVLLGLSAAISHSLLIWILAAAALHYGSQMDAENIEPYLQIASAVLILLLALWMFLRTRREVREAASHGRHHHHDHVHDHASKAAPAGPAIASEDAEESAFHHSDHDHSHLHAHAAPVAGGLILPPGMETGRPDVRGPHGGMLLDTGHGWLEVSIFEDDHDARFRVYPCKSSGATVALPKNTTVAIETARMDGSAQRFPCKEAAGFWEASATLPEPHSFLATVIMSHGNHAHTYKIRFTEDHDHHGSIAREIIEPDDVYQDAHERAHAEDIAKRFGNRAVTTPQIILFGITGGLIPCPAAFTILLLCLQLKRVTLGFAIVGAFSFGLALTMVTVGAVAAWSVGHAQKRFKGFGEFMRRAPYISCVLLVVLASFMMFSGWAALAARH